MDIKIKKEKDVLKIFEIKKIEGIKTTSKLISMLIKLYDENLRLQNLLAKTKSDEME